MTEEAETALNKQLFFLYFCNWERRAYGPEPRLREAVRPESWDLVTAGLPPGPRSVSLSRSQTIQKHTLCVFPSVCSRLRCSRETADPARTWRMSAPLGGLSTWWTVPGALELIPWHRSSPSLVHSHREHQLLMSSTAVLGFITRMVMCFEVKREAGSSFRSPFLIIL